MMQRLCQAVMALALVVPALAVPGFMPTTFQQQPMDKAPGMMRGDHPHMPHQTPAVVFQSPGDATTIMSPPTELFKRKSDKKPDSNPCTPGDRYCHASLEHILFCNDDQQWATYSQCPKGTFCHRLTMVCVREVFPDDPDRHSQHAYDDDPHQCKEGDRRCSKTFNRVDRCNGSHEWVTYHDCRKSELCDGNVLECIPNVDTNANGLKAHSTVKPNGTATTHM
ncbi:hypothetical protein F4859DRAFT_407651 [Xylaria cf. heliscus]|nr:hypothetical protein F4859DRAFT_407651 [Xylaria cf. heliscus]